MKLDEIAVLVDGRLTGNADLVCTGANPPDQAQAGEITMLDDPKRAAAVAGSGAVAVITSSLIDDCSCAQVVVDDPRDAFAKIVSHFRPPVDAADWNDGISADASVHATAIVHPRAIIAAGAVVGARTRVGPGVVISARCQIGQDCVLNPNVTLYEYTELGDRVVIHAGVVVGAHGFGYRQKDGRHIPTAQLGYVAIESDVEIGAGATIDRGTYGATRIGEGTKIDNQVMIAHNCQIGKHNLLCSQVGIAGSSCTGDYVILAGQVGLKDHVHLGDHTIVGAQAGVMDDCPGNEVYLGSPATPQREQMQIMAVERRLPEMRREVKKLRRELDAIKGQLQSESTPAASCESECNAA
ncbi:UDP-3-O-acylglucosamine N-acyltransferase [Rubripirellula lacrimiformis]|uniref:UDP-3-O-acylglucosamine N-acyltransferase n=1 Tax=Rubripirellula lacrimiformis TaxID=1930273 RepID=A0A517NBN3_9BACT|nr:UDP-3-O-(3-hydroxymyristoyl)glucosamine N-acyltransferase [Rubripirellula lacrimiformis]QDT04418.1 UDP-3-O-acylglucosamine N-acyltransferase [Rubripirellula lacrimiformis]